MTKTNDDITTIEITAPDQPTAEMKLKLFQHGPRRLVGYLRQLTPYGAFTAAQQTRLDSAWDSLAYAFGGETNDPPLHLLPGVQPEKDQIRYAINLILTVFLDALVTREREGSLLAAEWTMEAWTTLIDGQIAGDDPWVIREDENDDGARGRVERMRAVAECLRRRVPVPWDALAKSLVPATLDGVEQNPQKEMN